MSLLLICGVMPKRIVIPRYHVKTFSELIIIGIPILHKVSIDRNVGIYALNCVDLVLDKIAKKQVFKAMPFDSQRI
jgi:hypothetical protein